MVWIIRHNKNVNITVNGLKTDGEWTGEGARFLLWKAKRNWGFVSRRGWEQWSSCKNIGYLVCYRGKLLKYFCTLDARKIIASTGIHFILIVYFGYAIYELVLHHLSWFAASHVIIIECICGAVL